MSRQFTRRVENFTCLYCGTHNVGDGYTNHCSECLYSLHVDHQPGDRLNDCRGLLEPVGVLYEKSRYIIEHRCQVCQAQLRCKASPHDNLESLHRVMTERAQNFWHGHDH